MATMRLTHTNGSRWGRIPSMTSRPQGSGATIVSSLIDSPYPLYGEKAKAALWPPKPSEVDRATFCG